MTEPTSRARPRVSSVVLFFVLACTITWLLDLPYVIACMRHETPPAHAAILGGLGAFGPTIAAIAVTCARRGELREVFGRWRTNPAWIVIALFAPMALHQVANLIEVALGGEPARWFYPPVEAPHIAALVLFSVGEEFGWRGLAYPRLEERYGPVIAALIVGFVWGIWHLGMLFTPEKGAPDLLTIGAHTADLVAWSLVFAWVFERGNRSMAVALALHAAGHLDNVTRGPETEVRLRVLRFVVLALVALVAARALAARRAAGTARRC